MSTVLGSGGIHFLRWVPTKSLINTVLDSWHIPCSTYIIITSQGLCTEVSLLVNMWTTFQRMVMQNKPESSFRTSQHSNRGHE